VPANQQVGQHQPGGLTFRGIQLGNIGSRPTHPIGHPVGGGVCQAHPLAGRVQLHQPHHARTQQSGGDAEHAGTAADIDHFVRHHQRNADFRTVESC
jgi:hypothetical protein